MNWLKLSKAVAEDAYTRSIKSVSPDGLGKESAIKTQLGLIKQTTGKDVKVEAVIDLRLPNLAAHSIVSIGWGARGRMRVSVRYGAAHIGKKWISKLIANG